MSMWRHVALVLLSILASGAGPAAAHDSRPAYLEIRQASPLSFAVRLQMPVSVAGGDFPALLGPQECAINRSGGLARVGEANIQQFGVECRSVPAGFFMRLQYPNGNPSLSTLVRYTSVEGALSGEILPPDRPRWERGEDQKATLQVFDYFGIGVEHILAGYDHLLFLGCLVWIAGTRRRILITVTGFTVSHSITLALAALDMVRLPTPPIEAVIALSVVFLACELVKGRRDSLTWKYPVSVSAAFGLLHGFAFAAALGEIGLPRDELALSLLLFNVGVEAGQLAVLAVLWCLLLIVGWGALKVRFVGLVRSRSEKALGYVIGSLASLLLLSRLAAFAA